MAFLRPDDDDDDFVLASGKSKLNSLFGGPNYDGNESLSGKSGKQPQPQAAPRRADDASQQKERAGPSEIFNACAVTAFRFSTADSRYQPAGQCGMALVGNLQAKDFKVVLYVTKQQQLGYAIVNGTFQFNVGANNYATFYDSAKTLWSVMFDSAKSLTEFCKYILLCRAACSNFATLLTLDTSAPAAGDADKEQVASVDVDDQIEVRYTAWLVDAFAAQPASLVKTVLDDNTASVKGQRFRVGQQKVVRGLEEGVIGMRRERGTKRLVFVPASSTTGLLASASTRAPPNTAVLFSVELVRVRDDATPSEDRNRAQSVVPLPAIPGADVPSQPRPQHAQSPVATVASDPDEEPSSNKAKLLNRMAKMGQAVLPTPQREEETSHSPAAATAYTQPSPTVPMQPPVAEAVIQPGIGFSQPVMAGATTPVHVSTVPMQAGMANTQTLLVGQPTLAQQYAALNQPIMGMHTQPNPAVSNALVPLNAAYAAAATQNAYLQYAAANGLSLGQPGAFYGQSNLIQAAQPPPPPPAAPPAGGDMQSFVMLNETRQNVVELRLQVGKLTDKVEKMYDKVADSGPTSAANAYGLPANVMLETQAVVNNIQRIVAENERLKRETYERSEKIETLNTRISELVAKNSVSSERGSALLESTGDRLKAEAHQQASRVLELENERLKLVSELAEKTGALTDVRRELDDARRREAESRTRLNAALSADETRRDESSGLRSQLAEITRENEDLRGRLRDERVARKQIETRATELDETVAELRESSSTLEKQLTERKRRNMADRQRFEQLMASERAAHEAELTTAREQAQNAASALDAAEAGRIDAARAQLEADLRSRYEKQLVAERTRLERAAKDEREERERATKQAAELADRVASLRADLTKREAELEQLTETTMQLRSANEKLERTTQRLAARTNDATERELEQAQAELATLRDRFDEAQRERDTLAKRCRELESAPPAPATVAAPADASGEVKRIMNSVFQSLRKQLDATTMYSGKDVLSVMLATIKATTLSMLTPAANEKQPQPQQPQALPAPVLLAAAAKLEPPVEPPASKPIESEERPAPIAPRPAESLAQAHVADNLSPPAEVQSSPKLGAQIDEPKPASLGLVSDAETASVTVTPIVDKSGDAPAESPQQEEDASNDNVSRSSVDSDHIVLTRAPAPTLAEPDLVSPVANGNIEHPAPAVEPEVEVGVQEEATPDTLPSRNEVPVGLDVVPGGVQPSAAAITDAQERADDQSESESDSDGPEETISGTEAQDAAMSDGHETSAAGPDLLPDDRAPAVAAAAAAAAAETALEATDASPQAQTVATSSKPDIMLAHPDEEHESPAHNDIADVVAPAEKEHAANGDESAATAPDSDRDEAEATPIAADAEATPTTNQAVRSTSDVKPKTKLFDDDDEDDDDNDVLNLFASAKPAAFTTRSDAEPRTQTLRPEADAASIKSDHKDTESVKSIPNTDSATTDVVRPAGNNNAAKKDGDDANKGKSATSSHSSLTSGARGAPPPLFADDDDDEDELDWLKSAK